MSIQVQLRGGTSSQNNGFTGAAREVTIDTTLQTLRVHDGITEGGTLIFGRRSILGAVSQSAGVPTGAVIQRGSNANGEFVRFADGTQISFPRVTPIWSSSDPAFSGTQSFTHPAAFVAPPTGGAMGIGSGNLNGQQNFASIRANGPGGGTSSWFCRFTGDGPGGSGSEAELSAIFIGRWY